MDARIWRIGGTVGLGLTDRKGEDGEGILKVSNAWDVWA